MKPKLIFVYGTLKRGGSNHALLAAEKFIGPARTAPGFRLWSLGDYPGMTAHAADRDGVTGEVWSVGDNTLARLDELEGLAEGLYRRERVPLLGEFAAAEVEVYLYARSVAGRADLGAEWIV